MSGHALRTRRATTEDANLVGRISAAAYIPAYLPLIGAAPKPAHEDYRVWIDRGEVWLGEIDGVPAGVLVLDRQSDHLLVYSVAVLPRSQGVGLGKALLVLAEERAVATDMPELRLYTNRRMERNLRLYERCGFTAVRERSHPIRSGEILVDMVKRVPRLPSATRTELVGNSNPSGRTDAVRPDHPD